MSDERVDEVRNEFLADLKSSPAVNSLIKAFVEAEVKVERLQAGIEWIRQNIELSAVENESLLYTLGEDPIA